MLRYSFYFPIFSPSSCIFIFSCYSYFYTHPVEGRLRARELGLRSGPLPFLPDRLAFQWSQNTHAGFLPWIFSLRTQIYEGNSILSLIAWTRRYSWCSAPPPEQLTTFPLFLHQHVQFLPKFPLCDKRVLCPPTLSNMVNFYGLFPLVPWSSLAIFIDPHVTLRKFTFVYSRVIQCFPFGSPNNVDKSLMVARIVRKTKEAIMSILQNEKSPLSFIDPNSIWSESTFVHSCLLVLS